MLVKSSKHPPIKSKGKLQSFAFTSGTPNSRNWCIWIL